MSEAFVRRANIDKLFDICLDLPNGSETDLISEYDKIMASLNLLRFLLIRDKQNKVSSHFCYPLVAPFGRNGHEP